MSLDSVGRAAALFAVTNVDDIVVLSLFFAQARGGRRGAQRVVLGQYLGFAAILAVAVAGGLGATVLPDSAIAYLGLLPLALGVRAAWGSWRGDGAGSAGSEGELRDPGSGPAVWQVATVTFANGGDNLGVYVPVFASAGARGISVYVAVFLVLVGVWCLAGWFFASRPVVAGALTRWGDVLLPVVLIAIGLLILIEGGAFGVG